MVERTVNREAFRESGCTQLVVFGEEHGIAQPTATSRNQGGVGLAGVVSGRERGCKLYRVVAAQGVHSA